MEYLEVPKTTDCGGHKPLEMDKVASEYLQELTCPEDEWNSLSKEEQDASAANLIERSYELEKEGYSSESIRELIPSYQIEAMDKNSYEGNVKYISDEKWQICGSDGRHMDNGYQRIITAQMKGGMGQPERQCFLTDDIKRYFGCKRISAEMVAKVEDKLKGKDVKFHYDPRQECNVLTGGLEQYMDDKRRLSPESYKVTDAPHDSEQIQLISETMYDMKELQPANWERLDINQRVEILNNLENKIAEIAHRPACPVCIEDKGPIVIHDGEISGLLGGYNPQLKEISINSELVMSNDSAVLNEVLDTLIHEGRHAYQDYNVNECEIHPRHSEVVSWSENMEGGKWGYCGGSDTLLGQRLYEQQSIEIDARNFAADILAKFEENKIA